MEYDQYDKPFDVYAETYSFHIGDLRYLSSSEVKSYNSKYEKLEQKREKLFKQQMDCMARMSNPDPDPDLDASSYEKEVAIFDRLIDQEGDIYEEQELIRSKAREKNREARIRYRLKLFPEECEFHW